MPDLTEPTHRLPAQPGEIIDRSQTFTFTFDGDHFQAHPGDTIASALTAAGLQTLSRSFKYHRPRGLLCCSGHCPNCLVQVSDEPNVRACTTPVEPGMAVNSQNAWPSLKRDAMALIGLIDRFLPVGFYYKAFIRPRFLWPVFEKVLRRAAGLGTVSPDTPIGDYDKQYIHTDVAVVGGGPAGLSAALMAARQGARVSLFEENLNLGGHLRYTGRERRENLPGLLSAIRQEADIDIFTGTTVLGWFEENWLSVQRQGRLYKVRARAVVFATGAYEQPLLFNNNDLPGVMLSSGVQRLLRLYSVVPGQRAVVVTANKDGWGVAADLQAAGVEVVAVADQRSGDDSPLVDQVTGEGTPVYWGHTITGAKGSGKVRQALIAPFDDQGRVAGTETQTLDCDLIVVAVAWAPANGLLYQAGGRLVYDNTFGEFLPQQLPDGIFAAGRVAGTHNLMAQIDEGERAGRQAAAFAGQGRAPAPETGEVVSAQVPPERPQTSTLVRVPGDKKQFLCYCEDVTYKDLKTAIAEGYDSLELLKRYSTISMGPCQGKMCSVNTIHLCARANGWTVEETGTTTARPPVTPVKLGVLAGQNVEPVQLTPIHDWHLAQGAKMMVAGLWLRPEHYGDPLVEVEAVRQRAGLIDISTLGKLRLTGPGVPDLLDRIYVNKWQKLAPGRVRYGVMCNDEGIILDDGVTARINEREWYTTTTSSGANAIYEWLQWWMQSGWGNGVHLVNVTEAYGAFNLAGPQSRAILDKLVDGDISADAFPYMSQRDMLLAGVPCRLMRIGFTGELSYEIHCPAANSMQVWEAILSAGREVGILPFGVEAQRILRLEKAHIIVGQDTDALSDPFAADMRWAVKLDKRDFLGQRSLSRIAAEGPEQRLVGFKMTQPGVIPEEGLQIVEQKGSGRQRIIGWVTSSRFSPTLGETIGLCWLPAGLAGQAGATFTIRRNGSLVQAQVFHGPFYDPSGERLRM